MRRVPVGKFKIGLIAQEREPHLTNDVSNDPRVGDPEWARREGMVAFAGYPLIVDDRTVGVVALFARHSSPGDTLEALASVANSIALGIERKQHEEAWLLSARRARRRFSKPRSIASSPSIRRAASSNSIPPRSAPSATRATKLRQAACRS